MAARELAGATGAAAGAGAAVDAGGDSDGGTYPCGVSRSDRGADVSCALTVTTRPLKSMPTTNAMVQREYMTSPWLQMGHPRVLNDTAPNISPKTTFRNTFDS